MKRPSNNPGDSLPQIPKTAEVAQAFIKNCEQRKLSKETIKWYRAFLKVLNDKYPDLPAIPEPRFRS
jgi:hypothetical protein